MKEQNQQSKIVDRGSRRRGKNLGDEGGMKGVYMKPFPYKKNDPATPLGDQSPSRTVKANKRNVMLYLFWARVGI